MGILNMLVKLIVLSGFICGSVAAEDIEDDNRCYPYMGCSWVYMITNIEPGYKESEIVRQGVFPQRIFSGWQGLTLDFGVNLGPKDHAPKGCSVGVKHYQDWFKHCRLLMKVWDDGGLVFVWDPNYLIEKTNRRSELETKTLLTPNSGVYFQAKIEFVKNGKFVDPGLYKIVLECNRDRVANELDGEPEDWAPGHGKFLREGGGIIQVVEPKTNRELAEEQVMMIRSLDLELEEELAHFRKANSLYPNNKYILVGIYRTLERLGREEEAKEALKRCREVYPACGRWTL
jgi:hypothetical protein